MRKFRILFLVMTAAATAPAQTRNDKNTEIEIAFGTALPLADFKSTIPSDSTAGFALNGTHVHASIAYLFSKNIGAVFMISHANNRSDETALRKKYAYTASQLNGSLSGISVGKWKCTSYMAGPSFVFNTRTFGAEVRALGGITNAKLPETELAIYDSTQTNALQIIEESAPSSSFGYSIGAGIKYFVSDLMLVSLHGDYFDASHKFKDVKTSTNFSDDELHSYQRKIILFSVTFGIGFRF